MESKTLNISFRLSESSPEGQLLSNLAHTPFELDGRRYASREGLWQGLYYGEDADRERIAQLFGREAKMSGRDKPKDKTHITYMGVPIEIGSAEHHAIMRRAIHASVEQNPDLRAALLSTGDKLLTHILHRPDGSLEPDSKSLPADKFTEMMMAERELQKRRS